MAKKKRPSPAEVDDTVEALAPFEPEGTEDAAIEVMVQALSKVLEGKALEQTQLAELESEDPTARIRQTYILSYLKTLDFLRRKADTFSERFAQARLAQSFIKHHESSKLSLLQMGRHRSDASLQERVTKLQGLIESQAAEMAKQMAAEEIAHGESRDQESNPPSQEQEPDGGSQTEALQGS
ncbi:MAG: hypothetical protein ACYTFZ_07220 [Planctomycetota bacterium]